MIVQRMLITCLTALLISFATSLRATECTYRLARDFQNIQSDVFRHDASTGDLIEFLSETEDTLVRFAAETNGVEPGLAESWEYDDKTKSLIFTLNKSCRWSDGTQLIANDVVYGFQQLFSHGVLPYIGGSLITGSEDIIARGASLDTLQVKALSNDKVSVGIIGDPNLALLYLSYISYSPLPSHVFNAEHVPLASQRRKSIGPFKVHSIEKDIIVLKRNSHYCSDQNIDVDQIELLNRKEGFWEFSELMAGRLDMIRYTPGKQLQTLRTQNDHMSAVRVELIDEKRQTYLLLNPLHDDFANVEIRKKLAAAIDFDSLVNRGNYFSRVRRVAKTLFYDLPNYQNHAYSTPHYSYAKGIGDLRATMEKYGYSSSNRLKSTIITYPVERFEMVAKMLSSMLRQAHFDITFVKSHSVSAVVKHTRAGRYEMLLQSWFLDYSDPQSSLDGLRQGLGYILDKDTGSTTDELQTSFVRPVNELLHQLKLAHNQTDRFAALQSIEELIIESGLAIPLYTEFSEIVVSSRIAELNGQFPRSRTLSLKGCSEARVTLGGRSATSQ